VIERAVSVAGATRSTIQALPIHVSQLDALRAQKAQAAPAREPASHVRTSAKLRAEINALKPASPKWLHAAGLASLGAVVFAATFELIHAWAGAARPVAPRTTTQLSPATQAPSTDVVAPAAAARSTGALGPSEPSSPALPRTAAAAAAATTPDSARLHAKAARPAHAPASRPAPERPHALATSLKPVPPPPHALATSTKPVPPPPRTAAAPDKPDEVRMGSDLRALRNRAAGWVDVEDPYRW
jgi:DnaK suppressor protein